MRATVAMGCSAMFAFAPVRGDQVRKFGITHTISQAWRIGQSILEARRQKNDPVGAILTHENGALLFAGKVTDSRAHHNGWLCQGSIALERPGCL